MTLPQQHVSNYWYNKARAYEKALREIKEKHGKVCSAYDICTDRDCVAPACGPWSANNASYGAWATADIVLKEQEPRL